MELRTEIEELDKEVRKMEAEAQGMQQQIQQLQQRLNQLVPQLIEKRGELKGLLRASDKANGKEKKSAPEKKGDEKRK